MMTKCIDCSKPLTEHQVIFCEHCKEDQDIERCEEMISSAELAMIDWEGSTEELVEDLENWEELLGDLREC